MNNSDINGSGFGNLLKIKTAALKYENLKIDN